MQANLTFSFPVNVSAHDAVTAVALHFGVAVSINGSVPAVPAHIKQAVESIGENNPANGVNVSPAMAFAGLVNGQGNNAPSTADVDPSLTALAANPAISQTSATGSSDPAPASAQGEHAPEVFVETVLHVDTDKNGLPWDNRIHSTPQAMTDKGVWRKKRGVATALVTQVEAELRAMKGNAVAPVATAQSTGANVFDKAAAVQWAHDEAIRVCGASPIEANTLAALLEGKPATLSPAQNDWYVAYFAKRNAAYVEYKERAENVASAASVGTVTVAPVIPAQNISAVASPDLDATGLPHDPRLHIAPAIKNPQGIYIQRMDISPEAKLALMAEIRATLAGNAQFGSPAGAVGATPEAPVIPAIPQVTAEQAGASFVDLMRWIVQNTQAGNIAVTTAPEVAKAFGFVNPTTQNGEVALMAQQVAYFPSFVATLQSMGAK
jgi:hypothetical protein